MQCSAGNWGKENKPKPKTPCTLKKFTVSLGRWSTHMKQFNKAQCVAMFEPFTGVTLERMKSSVMSTKLWWSCALELATLRLKSHFLSCKWLTHSKLQLPHQYNRNNNSNYLRGLFWGLNAINACKEVGTGPGTD